MTNKKSLKNKITLAISLSLGLAVTGCSNIDLQNDKSSSKLNNINSYSMVEVRVTESESKESNNVFFNLEKNRLPQEHITTLLGNKMIDLKISIEDCLLCDDSDMQANVQVRSEEKIKITEIGFPTEIQEMEIITLPPLTNSDAISDGETLVEDSLEKNKQKVDKNLSSSTKVAPTVNQVAKPLINPESAIKNIYPPEVTYFSEPHVVQPFLYKDTNVQSIYQPHITQSIRKPLQYNEGIFQEVISKSALDKYSTISYDNAPIVVEIRLIKETLK